MKTETFNIVCTLLWSGTLLAGLVTAWVYYRQLRTMQIGPLIQFLESPSVRAARRTIMIHREEIEAKPYVDRDTWPEEVIRAVAEACAAYNVAGHLAKLNKVETDFIIEHWGDSARRIRKICASYIDVLRERDGMRYMSGLIWFAEAAERSSPPTTPPRRAPSAGAPADRTR